MVALDYNLKILASWYYHFHQFHENLKNQIVFMGLHDGSGSQSTLCSSFIKRILLVLGEIRVNQICRNEIQCFQAKLKHT